MRRARSAMRRGRIAASVMTVACVAVLALAACGGDDDDDQTAARTPGATSTLPGTTISNGSGTALPTGCTRSAATVSPADATLAAASGTETAGGDPASARCPVSTIPRPPAGRTPSVDSTAMADPLPETDELEIFVDMDASEPGIQAEREVKLGDVFRVAVVVANAPPVANNVGGVASFNFILNYDARKVIAPTYVGGPTTERNPWLNVPGLGGADALWTCLPTPEGDRDDPGGIEGNGDPVIGQAFLQCFTPGTGRESGTIVLAVVEFHAIGRGKSEFLLSETSINDVLAVEYAHCETDASQPPIVPCSKGLVDVTE